MKSLCRVACLLPLNLFAQPLEPLHYFLSEQDFLGVKNDKGEIVIPAQFVDHRFRTYKNDNPDGELVDDGLIHFMFRAEDNLSNGVKEPNSIGYLYDRKGNFICHPLFYDGGADYFSEGKSRCVRNGKIGFIDYDGKMRIEPKYDFVFPFNYGYAEFCNGCRSVQDGEYRKMEGGSWGVINFNGKVVQPLATRQSERDIEIHGKFYPSPFDYNRQEQKILDFFYQQEKLLAALSYVNYAAPLTEAEKKLYFEIVAAPTENLPYYLVLGYNREKMHLFSSGLKFLVSSDGTQIYKANVFEKKEQPFAQWLQAEINAALDYQREHPDMPNKFKLSDFK